VPDFAQSPPGLDPPTVVDHVLLPVIDLEEGARRLRERYGLQAVAGGRHSNMGTANMIVPLGRQYLELIAVADPLEASTSRLGRAVRRALAEGRTLMAWALRTADLDALRAKLLAAGWDLPPISEGSRRRPDGQVLRWRTQDISTGDEATALPFAIEWDVPRGLYPGEAVVEQRVRSTTIRRVVVGTPVPGRVREQLRLLLGDGDLHEVREAAVEGIQQLLLASPDGPALIA
jgi:Glyoxalase-like domain